MKFKNVWLFYQEDWKVKNICKGAFTVLDGENQIAQNGS